MQPSLPRRRAIADSAVLSMKDWPFRLMLSVLVILSLTLIVMNRLEHPLIIQLRTKLTDITAPAVQFVASPSKMIGDVGVSFERWAAAYQQNATLVAENERLKEWRSAAGALHAENLALRALLNLAPSAGHHFISARIIGQMSNPFGNSLLLSTGKNAGIIDNMTVITGDGMVGRTIDTGMETARILPITDINSRISIITETSRERAIVVGQNKPTLQMKYTPDEPTMQVGERVVTSGDNKLLPANIPVGVITAIKGTRVEVTPLVEWSRLDYVSLIQPQ